MAFSHRGLVQDSCSVLAKVCSFTTQPSLLTLAGGTPGDRPTCWQGKSPPKLSKKSKLQNVHNTSPCHTCTWNAHMHIHAYKHICTYMNMQISTCVQAHTCKHALFLGVCVSARESKAGCLAGHTENWHQWLLQGRTLRQGPGRQRGFKGDLTWLLKVF